MMIQYDSRAYAIKYIWSKLIITWKLIWPTVITLLPNGCKRMYKAWQWHCGALYKFWKRLDTWKGCAEQTSFCKTLVQEAFRADILHCTVPWLFNTNDDKTLWHFSVRFCTGAQLCLCTTAELFDAWWRHQMETFSALLAICAGNSPVTGEFPTQSPVTRSFDVFFDLRLNKRLSKQ